MTHPGFPSIITILFTRQDTYGISNAAILTMALNADATAHVYPPEAKCPASESQERALGLLDSALSRWIEQTDQGQEAWKASCEDLNAGDMATYGFYKDPTLTPFLIEQGIEIKSLDTLGDMAHADFDRILANPDL